MDDQWGSLLDILRRELAAVRELSELGQKKRTAIRELDVAALEETNAREELRSAHLRELGQTRRALLARLSPAGMAADGSGPSLREMIPLMPLDLRGIAGELRQDLLDEAGKLSQVTQGNAELLKSSIERVDRLAQMLLGGGHGEVTYQVKGKRVKPMESVVDRRG